MAHNHDSGYLFGEMDPSRRFSASPNSPDGPSRPSRRESRINDENEGDVWHIRVDEEAVSRRQRVRVKTERADADPFDRVCAEVEAEMNRKLKAAERNDIQFAVLQAERIEKNHADAKMVDFYKRDTEKFLRTIAGHRPGVQKKIREILEPYLK